MANNRVVLVTGASAGFGKATALLLAARGDRVYGAFRGSNGGFDATAGATVEEASARGVRVETVPLDVRDDASVAECVDRVLVEAGRIDALVNNAGFGVHGPWETISVAQLQAQLDTNLVGVFRMCRAVAPTMRRQGAGWIVNVSSDAALRTAFWEAAYSASKYALEGMSLGMRLESQQFGIRVAMVNPGWFVTGYEAAMTSTVDWDEPDGPYGPLVEAMLANQAGVEAGRDDVGAVAEAIAGILDSDDPPFNTLVGAGAARTADANVAEYERTIFAFYGLDRFRAPYAEDPA